MERWREILEFELLGNPVRAWLIALAVALVCQLVLWLLQRRLSVRLKKIADRTTTRVDDLLLELLGDIKPLLIFVLSLVIGAQVLNLDARTAYALRVAAVIAAGIQLLFWSRRVVDFGLESLVARSAQAHNGQADPGLVTSMGILRFLVMLAIGIVVVLVALDNMGVKVTPMLAGLGVGGIAVALAVQNILGDLFGSLSIVLDKPFVVGDFIVVGDQKGTVERIGIKTTRVRALSGEQLVFANTDLLKSRVQNFKRMQTRRASFVFGVEYSTPTEALARIPAIVEEAINREENARFVQCFLIKLGASSLDFEAVFNIASPDNAVYLGIQQRAFLKLLDRFRAENISFAFPTQVEIQRHESREPTPPPPANAAASARG